MFVLAKFCADSKFSPLSLCLNDFIPVFANFTSIIHLELIIIVNIACLFPSSLCNSLMQINKKKKAI